MVTIKRTCRSIAKLEQEREQYKKQRDELIEDVKKLREALIKTQNLADELMDIQVKYMNLTEHIKDKALHNPSVHRYIDLVHVIDDLERDTHEG